MKPSELYAREPQDVTKDIFVLDGYHYHHVPELQEVWGQLDLEKNTRVDLHRYKYVNYDGRRFWLLAGVYLDGKPVMIVRNAGREGDDHHSRFVTDPEAYGELVKYLATLFIGPPGQRVTEVVSPDQDIKGLEEFYGNSLLYDGRW